jgi:choline kinase
MYSLYLTRDIVRSTFLLLDSDIIYEQAGIQSLIDSAKPNAVLTSGLTGAGDEVFVCTQNGRLTGLSKHPHNRKNITGEMVGISKISPVLFKAMLEYAEKFFARNLNLEYEACIEQAANHTAVYYCLAEDLLWSEIDDASQLERANNQIFPLIVKKEVLNHRR